MANWVSASTTDYWQDFAGGVTYLGGGSWECGTGPSATSFYESWNSPFLPDPYYYTSTTHYGIRFTLSWNPDTWNRPVKVSIVTNESGYDSYDQTLTFPTGTTTNHSYLIEWTPVASERIIEIRIIGDGYDFGSNYGSTPIVSGIEVDTEGGGEPEPETRCVLYKHTGFIEVVEVIDAPTSSGGSYGTTGTTTQSGGMSSPVSPLSGGMWGTPIQMGQPGIKFPQPKKIPTPGGGSSGGDDWGGNSRTNAVIVRAVDEDGNKGSVIYETDNDGNLTRQISGFIPDGGL